MIKQIKSSEIEKSWNRVVGAISACLPSKQQLDSYAIGTIKQALIADDMQCWIVADDNKVAAIALTAVYADRFTGARALLVYGLYTTKRFNKGLWQEWMSKMDEFAKLKDCYNVVSIRKLGR